MVEITAEGGLVDDSFQLTVTIPEMFAAEFNVALSDVDVTEEDGVYEATVTVDNTGNADITEGITFVMEDLLGGTGSVIPAANVVVDPPTAGIGYGDYAEFDLNITVPEGLLGQVYTGTLSLYHDGVFQDDIDVTVTVERGDEISVWPNPARLSEGVDGITISLNGGGDGVSVNVYDMFGALVAELASGARDTDIQWELTNDDGTTVATGMYIVTIDTGDEVVTRKIMVIK